MRGTPAERNVSNRCSLVALHERTTFHTGRITVARPTSEAANANWFLISIAHGAKQHRYQVGKVQKAC